MANEVRNGAAIIRPPGHHAEAGCAMGFCLFNNVAVAAAVARGSLGAARVLIVGVLVVTPCTHAIHNFLHKYFLCYC